MSGFKSKVNVRRGRGQYRTEALRLESSKSFKDEWDKCRKSQFHKDYVDTSLLSTRFKDSDLLELVEVRFKLTGQLVIDLSHYCEQQFSTCFVEEVVKCPSEAHILPEPANQVKGFVTVSTALHAVYVDDERMQAQLCRVELDGLESLGNNLISDENKDQLHLLQAEAIYGENRDTDYCLLRCVTYDADLIEKLTELTERHYRLGSLLADRYSQMAENDRDVIIVSYPHGWGKRVSIGKVSDKKLIREVRDFQDYCDYTYDLITCPGSSGASVYVQGKWKDGFGYWFGHSHVHSGSYDDNTGQSSGGVDVSEH